MFPALEDNVDADSYWLPHGSFDIGNGYTLLCAKDETPRQISEAEAVAFCHYLVMQDGLIDMNHTSMKLTRWARLRLPNGQIAHSAWKENMKPLDRVHISCNVKMRVHVSACI